MLIKLNSEERSQMADNIVVDELVASTHHYSGTANGYNWNCVVNNDGLNHWVVESIEWDNEIPFNKKEITRLEQRVADVIYAVHQYTYPMYTNLASSIPEGFSKRENQA